MDEEKPNAAQFVRTFASDAAALKAGQAPDFENKGSAQSASPPPMPVSVIPPMPATPSVPQPLDLDHESETPIEALAPKPPAPPPPLNTPIHTYKSDFADEVKDKNASQADIIAAEQDAAPAKTPAPMTPRKRVDTLVVLSFVLIFIGIGSASGAYYWRLTHPTSIAPAAVASAPIFVDERQEISGTGSTLASAIAISVASPPAANAIRLLYTADSSATTSVWSALDLPAPDILLRSIVPAGSMAGVVNVNGTASPFFILAVESYSDSFSGMLAFEPTMEQSLATLYPPTSATGTPAWKDETITNDDVRALVDSAGNTLLLYGYFNQQTLIIARDENAFAAVLDRLTNSRTAS